MNNFFNTINKLSLKTPNNSPTVSYTIPGHVAVTICLNIRPQYKSHVSATLAYT